MTEWLEMKKSLDSIELNNALIKLYGSDARVIETQKQRYVKLGRRFEQHFGSDKFILFSSPGRTEIGGNHTDHNHGRVLAAGVHLDSIAAAYKTSVNVITIYSEGFESAFEVNLEELKPQTDEKGTTAALIRGIAARMKNRGFEIGGFNAVIQSEVLVGSGLSSSASIEVLIGTILNHLYNDGKITPEMIALIGQYAENKFFGKPCGLMDQLACAVGGIITIDFADPNNPQFEQILFDLQENDYSLLVVDTGGNHADLTDDYASITSEMKSVAAEMGNKVCSGLSISQLLESLDDLRKSLGDRALLRAIHFIQENQRVGEQVQALENGELNQFLSLITESGLSSFKWLQNCYSTKNPTEQGISLALALSEQFLKNEQVACRVHGGGFAGTIQVFLPKNRVSAYRNMMEKVFGSGSVIELYIREEGAICLSTI